MLFKSTIARMFEDVKKADPQTREVLLWYQTMDVET